MLGLSASYPYSVMLADSKQSHKRTKAANCECYVPLASSSGAFSWFDDAKALIAFFASLGMPPRSCLRTPESVSTCLILCGFLSMSLRIRANCEASGIHSPPPTKL